MRTDGLRNRNKKKGHNEIDGVVFVEPLRPSGNPWPYLMLNHIAGDLLTEFFHKKLLMG